MKTLVWGSGFISSHLKYDTIKERATINPQEIRSILQSYKTDTLINCIGYCGERNIDDCLENKEKTIVANTTIPIIIANECNKLGIQMIHISSGCIFNGPSPNSFCSYCNGKFSDTRGCFCPGEYWNQLGWTEIDTPNPVSFYSETKMACDYAIGGLDNVACLRIRMPISTKNSTRNYISKIRNYNKIIDIPNSATFVSDLVRCIDWCIENNKAGLYNVINPEPINAKMVMDEYKKYVPGHQFSIISSRELDEITASKRSNCILDGNKLKNEGFVMGDTKEMLEKTMKEYISNLENNK